MMTFQFLALVWTSFQNSKLIFNFLCDGHSSLGKQPPQHIHHTHTHNPYSQTNSPFQWPYFCSLPFPIPFMMLTILSLLLLIILPDIQTQNLKVSFTPPCLIFRSNYPPKCPYFLCTVLNTFLPFNSHHCHQGLVYLFNLTNFWHRFSNQQNEDTILQSYLTHI